MGYESLFVNPNGRASRGAYIGALAALLAAAVFYYVLVKGRSGVCSMAVLIFPYLVLHARRLHDIGQTAWLLIAPGGLWIAAAYLQLTDPKHPYAVPVVGAALGVSVAFALWCVLVKGKPEANKYGAPAGA